MQTIVLSNSVHETYAWADAQGRHRRTVRHIPHAASLQGRGYDGIVELPSFSARRDRHAVLAQLKKLRRSLPRIPYELDEDWVMPEKPKKVEPKHVEPEVFLFSNTPEADEPEQKSLGDLWFDSVAMGAEEDFSVDEDPQAEFDSITEEVGQVSENLTKLGEDMDKDAKYDAIAEISELGSDDPAPKPKRKGRRTNEQKAYDEALATFESIGDESASIELDLAYQALIARHPDDERVVAERNRAEKVASDLPDLDF